MRQIALIRCARIGPEEKRLRQQLARVFPTVAYVVDDMGNQHGSLPHDAVRLGTAFVAEAGLRIFPGVGWQCGDYAYYAARKALPDFDFAWMIEPDVGFTFPRLADFFDLFADQTADLLAPHFGPRGDWWYWFASMAPFVGVDRVFGSAFPITRLSARAVDALLTRRAALLSRLAPDAPPRAIPNDEAFCASTLVNAGFSCADMAGLVPPATFHPDSFSTGMMVDPRELGHPLLADRVVHSVRPPASGRGRLRHLHQGAPDEWQAARRRMLVTLGPEAWQDWTAPD